MKQKFKYLDKYFTYFINNPNERGMLKNVPLIIVDKMLEYQVEQENKLDITVFIENSNACKKTGGFNWNETQEGNGVWNDILSCDVYNSFFKYWKNIKKEAENILVEISEDENDNEDKISANEDLQSIKNKISNIIKEDSEILSISSIKSDYNNIDCIKIVIGRNEKFRKEISLKNKVIENFAKNYTAFTLPNIYSFIKDNVNTLEWEDKPWLEIKHNSNKRASVKFEQEFNDIGDLKTSMIVAIKSYNDVIEDFEIEKTLSSKIKFDKTLDEQSPEFYEILSNFIK